MSVLTPIINNIDGTLRRIYLKQGVSDYYPIEDIYHEYRNLRRTDENLRKYEPLLRAEGNVPKGGGAFTPRYVVLLDGTKIVPYDESLQINQLGDMITDDPDTDPTLYDISGLTTAKAIFIKPSEAETIQLNSSAIEYSTFQMSVWLDPSSGNAGTDYPFGNREYPVDNWADAITIANARGFAKIGLLGNSTIDGNTNIEDFEIFGQTHVNTHLVVLDSALTQRTVFKHLKVTGVLDGGSEIDDCMIGDLAYVNGHIHDSSLYGLITLAGEADAVFVDCFVVGLHNLPVIDMGGTGQDLIMTNWKGQLTVKNMTGALDDIAIGMDSGLVIVDSTISGGKVTLNGVGAVTDNHTGTAEVNHLHLVKGQQLNDVYELSLLNKSLSFNGQVLIDIDNGVAGTDYPIGTSTNPSSNIIDAKAIAIFNHIEKFHIHGIVVLDSNFDNYTFESDSSDKGTVDFNGQSVSYTTFFNLSLIGNPSSHINATDCEIPSGMTGIAGHFENCTLDGVFVLDASIPLNGDRCSFPSSASFNMNGTGKISLANSSGVVNFSNATDPSCILSLTGIYLATLDNTLTAGQALIAGIGILNNNVSGMAVIERTLPSATWNENLHTHTTPDTAGYLVHGINYLEPSVYIDTELVDNGNGTSSNPFNNVPDGVDFAESVGWKRIKLLSDATVDRPLKNFVIEGIGNLPTVDFNGQDVNRSEFLKVKLTGIQVGSITAREVILLNLSGANGVYKDSGIIGDVTLADDAIVTIASASNIPINTSPAPNNINMGNGVAGAVLNLRKYSGGIELTNVNNVNRIATCEFSGGQVIINGSNTDGVIKISGLPDTAVTNTSAGSTVITIGNFDNAQTITNALLDEPIDDHLDIGSVGHYMRKKLLSLANFIGLK